MAYLLNINGVERRTEAPKGTPLLSILREEFGLCGPKFGCGEGECGACMVLANGAAITSCDLAVQDAQGLTLVTLEGLGSSGTPHPIQDALIAEQAGQCGYCLSGIAVSAAALLAKNNSPSREEICAALDRNLCRCGSHNRIIRAVEQAAKRISDGSA
jgi:nicotinate dehydrogenase subunit A